MKHYLNPDKEDPDYILLEKIFKIIGFLQLFFVVSFCLTISSSILEKSPTNQFDLKVLKTLI